MSRGPTAAIPAPSVPRPRNIGNLLFMTTIVAIIGSFFVLGPGTAWDTLFINPLINALMLLNNLVFGQFGIAIILFTMLLRLATIPFTIRQLQSTRAMQAAQPRIQEVQKKYKDPKRRQEEMIKLYREFRINPLGCIMPLAIQMLVFIALYRSLVHMVGGSPESLIGLSDRLYSWSYLAESIPLNQGFLWLNLGEKDSTFILPLLVGLSTYVQTRLSQSPSMTAQQQQQQQMMTFMMPLMMVWITLALPSGVGVYWVVSNVFSLFASYYVYGRKAISWRQLLNPLPAPTPTAKKPRPEPPEKNEKNEEIEEVDEEAESTLTTPQSQRARRAYGRKRRGKRKDRR